MKFGAHVSIAGGVWNAPANAAAFGCESFQMFTRPPQGGRAPELTPEVVKKFKNECQKFGFTEYVVHAPYFINLASSENRIRKGSVQVIREELERASLLGAKYLMTHVGSARDVGEDKGLKMVCDGLVDILDDYDGSCQFLIEISAGSGMIIGDSFEELAAMLEAIDKKTGYQAGVCFDTQHAFASGYDLRTQDAISQTLKHLDKTVGLERVMMSHANDSKTELGSRKDRHEHLGHGQIGLEAFRVMVNHPKLKQWLFILETPWPGQKEDLAVLKKLRKKK